MEYDYDGNQLTSIFDGNDSYEYSYDYRGNMTYAGKNGLDFEYNHLNLIQKVKQGDTTIANYRYLADGTKLSAVGADGRGMEYHGSLVYRRDGDSLKLESAPFAGGRIYASEGTNGTLYTPYHYITDHLGSTRVVVNGASGEVVETNNYYPFGSKWVDNSLKFTENNYTYNGKEEQGFVNVPFIDYGARMLDNKFRLGWNGVDALAEDYFSYSPYILCGNNPVNYIDPNGMNYYRSSAGSVFWHNSNSNEIERDGVVYTNIGASYSVRTTDNTYANYYQNQLISVTDGAVDASQTVLNSTSLTGKLLSNDSPLSESSKQELMTSVIHKGQGDFIKGTLTVGASGMQTLGDALSTTGYVATAVTGGASTPLIVLGNVLSIFGTAIEVGVNINNGQYAKAGYTGVTTGVMKGIGDLGKFSPARERAIYNLILLPFDATLSVGGSKIKK